MHHRAVKVLRLRPVGRRFSQSQHFGVRFLEQLELGHFLRRGAGVLRGGRRLGVVGHAPGGPVRRRTVVRRSAAVRGAPLPARHLVGPLELHQMADVPGLGGRRLAVVPRVFLVLHGGRQLFDDVPLPAGLLVHGRLRLLRLLLQLLLVVVHHDGRLVGFGFAAAAHLPRSRPPSLLRVAFRLFRAGRRGLHLSLLLLRLHQRRVTVGGLGLLQDGRHQRVVLARGRRGRHFRSGRRTRRHRFGTQFQPADAVVVAFVVVLAAAAAAAAAIVLVLLGVLQQRQPLALVLGLGRPLEHGEYLAEQLPVFGSLPEAALHRAGVVVDAEPAVVAVRYRAQERSGEERLGLRALVARLVREPGRRRCLRLRVFAARAAVDAHLAAQRPLHERRRGRVVLVLAVRQRVAVERRELAGHLQLFVQRYAVVLLLLLSAVLLLVHQRRRERVVFLLDFQQRLVFVHKDAVRIVLRIVFP